MDVLETLSRCRDRDPGGPPEDPERSRSCTPTVATLTRREDIPSPPSPLSGLTCQRQRERGPTRLKRGDAGLLYQIRPVGPTDGSLFGDGSILAIRTDVETESGISWESLSVHPCEHWALGVDVIVDFDR